MSVEDVNRSIENNERVYDEKTGLIMTKADQVTDAQEDVKGASKEANEEMADIPDNTRASNVVRGNFKGIGSDADKAKNKVNDLNNKLNSLPRNVTTTINVRETTTKRTVMLASETPAGRANLFGGEVVASNFIQPKLREGLNVSHGYSVNTNTVNNTNLEDKTQHELTKKLINAVERLSELEFTQVNVYPQGDVSEPKKLAKEIVEYVERELKRNKDKVENKRGRGNRC